MKIKNTNSIKAVDFFCGGGGMSFGMQKAGIQVLAGVDYEENCRATYNANIGKDKFVKADVFELKEEELEKTLKLKRNDDELLLIGCSPCQFWSIINTDKNKSQKSKNLLVEFERFVKYFNPGYVVVENVPGVLRKKGESGLEKFINWLESNKYTVHFKVHNTSDYGVPQNRKRFTLIANRITDNKLEPIKANKKLTVRDVLGEENGFSKIKAGHKDYSDFNHTAAGITDITLRRIKK
ncbi:DNA-cytosine methyltransferase [Winogradskyella psychrotolerans RS-3]|uniref:DNA (cytosine-5-)-methyltransferase n=1 Tax=Winogradskyella psychrotolerans RS-3 TaxID=641526 RepID=S7X9Y0_9FLAO|nr:DNA cytosine methyltransferase [Winogradskyella psychrotolerans]EPR72838.1 DNA-cytosine methyltransferase [Winogradskyella psychrotolerans RS-3]